jgi:hypothetical protein
MKLKELTQKLNLQSLTPETAGGETEISGGYVSDLLSDVLAHAPKDGVLVTVQVHLNVIAVAVHAELAAIVFASGRTPDDVVRAKAVEEGVALYRSEQSAFDIVGRLYELGVRGPQE